jgi:hypothetical protein
MYRLTACRRWNESAPHPAEVAPTLTVKESEPEVALSFAHLVCVCVASRCDPAWSNLQLMFVLHMR